MNKEEKFGYLKFGGYNGGIIGIQEMKKILDGIDESFKFILKNEYDGDDEIDFDNFDFPIKIEEGSLIIELIIASIIFSGGVYFKSALEKLAENDVGDKTSLDVWRDVKKNVYSKFFEIIKIKKHIKGKEFETGKFVSNNQEIEIINVDQEKIVIPVDVIGLFKKIPKNLFDNIIYSVHDVNNFEFVNLLKEESIIIDNESKDYLMSGELNSDIILPELEHGQEIELVGKITKINETWKTLGFDYEGYILILKPLEKSLLEYKNEIIADSDKILTKAKIKGVVTRLGSNGKIEEKKPKIIFSEIKKIKEEKDEEQKLFD